MTNPTPLSPAAQAVLDAAVAVNDLVCTDSIAAALRAAVDQVVPATECYKARHDNCCESSVKQERSDIRILLRDIAFELEAQ